MLKYEIVKLEQFSGNQTTIYTILPSGEPLTLFEEFLVMNQYKYNKETKDIIKTLYTIGHHTGAREQFFRLGEGSWGENIVALNDKPNCTLRLYCIRFNMDVILLGGGGQKKTRSWQEDPILNDIVNKLKIYSNDINRKLDSHDLFWSQDKNELLGNLKIEDNEEF